MDGAEAKAVSETRHRMANNQQLLAALARLRAQRSLDPEVARQLLWVAEAISLLGVLERRRVGDGVDLAALLAEMAPIWRRRHQPGAAEVVLETEEIIAPDSAASTFALIAQELVVNALSHGRPLDGRIGRVVVRLVRKGPVCELSVIDDGPGYVGAAPADRFGLWLVRSLTGQVRGTFNLANAGGTTATLEFPL